MKIEVTMIKENPDGSADCTLDLDEEGIHYLLKFALVRALEDAIKLAGEEYTPRDDRQMELFDE
jgi:hypothetical protein